MAEPGLPTAGSPALPAGALPQPGSRRALARARARPAPAVTRGQLPAEPRARASSTVERRPPARRAVGPAPTTTARRAPQALLSSGRPRRRPGAHSTQGRPSVEAPRATGRPSQSMRVPPVRSRTARLRSRLELEDSTTARLGWVSLVIPPALPMPELELREAGRSTRAPPRAAPRGALVLRLPAIEGRVAAVHPTTGPVPLEGVAEGPAKQQAPAHPSSAPAVTREGRRPEAEAIPRSGRARALRLARVRWGRPRWAPALLAARRVRPRFPGARAMPRVDPSLVNPTGAPRQSGRSGSAREPPSRAAPRSTRLQQSGLPRAMPGEPAGRTSSSCGGAARACRECRRSTPPPPGLCMRIEPTSGDEPPLCRFRP